jgi:hypothetical protein
MEHLVVTVPDVGERSALSLLHDLVHRCERRREVAHDDDPPAPAVGEVVADLPTRVAMEHRVVAPLRAQLDERVTDREVELGTSIRGRPPTALSRFAANVKCSISSISTLSSTSRAAALRDASSE